LVKSKTEEKMAKNKTKTKPKKARKIVGIPGRGKPPKTKPRRT